MRIQTGKGTISPGVLLAIWSVSAVTSLPGLAVSPILGDLNRIFPHATNLEIQMLTSLPSLLIIPFVLLSGRLSVGRDKFRTLTVGLIAMSCLLGVGAGMVIPFSTGLVVDYFTGGYRIRQLGYSSAISNLVLVAATALAGYLAGIDWHLPFLVYLLPGLSLALVFRLRRQPSAQEPPQSLQLMNRSIDRRKLVGLMAFYFFITYAALAVVFYASFLVERYGLGSSFSGGLISLFFLAVMLPGLFIDRVIVRLKGLTNLVSLALLCLGLAAFGVFHHRFPLLAGAAFAGLGYGIMQPVIYDKAATIAPPRSATLALSFVMAMNYLAVVACPFIVDAFRSFFHLHGEHFPFLFNAVWVAVVWVAALLRRDSFTLGLGKSYYVL